MKMRLPKQNQQGFTLVEILIVMGIVGLIASVIMTSVALARAKGRDAKRKSDLTQMHKALEIYYNTNNSYPHTCVPGPTCAIASARWYGLAANGTAGFKDLSGATGYIPNLAPTFISNLPVDPSGNTTNWSGYIYKSDGVTYKIVAHATGPESFPASNDYFYDPCRPTTAWKVTNDATTTASCINW